MPVRAFSGSISRCWKSTYMSADSFLPVPIVAATYSTSPPFRRFSRAGQRINGAHFRCMSCRRSNCRSALFRILRGSFHLGWFKNRRNHKGGPPINPSHLLRIVCRMPYSCPSYIHSTSSVRVKPLILKYFLVICLRRLT